MEGNNTICPVCTLYLRPGITLKSHLSSHPKQKVIEALVRLSNVEADLKDESSCLEEPIGTTVNTWAQGAPLPINTVSPNFAMSGNHSFIYQQIMSTSSQQPNVLNINPLTQQYVTIPTVFNQHMVCPPYMYQQQQVIVSAGSTPPSKTLSIESSESETLRHYESNDDSIIIEKIQEPGAKSGLVIITETTSDNEDESLNIEIVDEADPLQVSEKKDYEEKKSYDEENKSYDEDDAKFVEILEEELKDEKCDKEDFPMQILVDDAISDVPPDPLPPMDDEFMEPIENFGSPRSDSSDYHIKVRTDLNKACQTSQNSSEPVLSPSVETDQIDNGEIRAEESYEPVFTSHPTVIQSTEQGSVVDFDGMHLVLSNDLISHQLVSQIEDFDYINRNDKTKVLMNLDCADSSRNILIEQRDIERLEENVSRESVNIRADEHMPPQGELSGQESNGGTSDITWSRINYHEGSSGMSTSYDLLARESWETSNGSDMDISRIPPPVSFNPDLDDTPTIISVTEPPLNFKCSQCGEGFSCPKERRMHQNEKHKKSKSYEGIGSKIGSKKVKKLVIKPKKEVTTENNFDFSNMLKLETQANESDPQGKGKSPNTVIVDQKVRFMCYACSDIFSTSEELKAHKETHKLASEGGHKCAICEEVFVNDVKYTEHLQIHPLECKLCGKYFYRRQNLHLHMKRHLGIRPYKCEVCEKSFLTKQKHDEHKNIHTGETPIKCSLCDETFRRHSNLVQHRNRHHYSMKRKVKDYLCYCGEVFHTKKKLAWHKEIHDPKPKACAHCSEKFIHMASLTRHMRRAHNERFVPKEERNNENVHCPICKGVYLRSSLEVHIRKHSGQKPFPCVTCGKDFTTKWNLKLHRWTHASRTVKPYKCDQCNGAFIREADYVAHMNSHKSVRPYTCNYCGTQFIRKYNCQRHVKEHEKGKTFTCQICGKAFHRSYYLKDHMRVHSGVRPFSCHICGKTSTTKSNHNKHVRIHHAREPVTTEN